MTKVDQLFKEYGESHQNSTNKLIHWIAVPSIVFSLLGLLWSIPFPTFGWKMDGYINWASFMIAFALYYYFQLSRILCYAMVLVTFGFAYLIVQIEKTSIPLWQASLIIFAIAWVFQFIGHKIEGKKPSFLKDVQFLLIGPLWLLHFIFKKVGINYNDKN